MYLFTRRVHARAGDLTQTMAWATGITERVHQITGLDFSLWSGVFGPEVGTLVWSAVVPDLAALEAAQDKLAVDGGYLAEATKGQQFAPEGANDRLFSIVHPNLDALAADATPPSYVSVVDAACAEGNLARGMEIGVRIAEKAEAITALSTMFCADLSGVYGAVAWLTGFRDIQEMEAANQALSAEPDFLGFLDSEAADVYSSDATTSAQRHYRRIM